MSSTSLPSHGSERSGVRARPSSSATPLRLIHGTLDPILLHVLTLRSNHGQGIARLLYERSGGHFRVQDRALYIALRRLEDAGYVTSAWALSSRGRRARYYDLTAAGRRFLRRRVQQLSVYAHAIIAILATTPRDVTP